MFAAALEPDDVEVEERMYTEESPISSPTPRRCSLICFFGLLHQLLDSRDSAIVVEVESSESQRVQQEICRLLVEILEQGDAVLDSDWALFVEGTTIGLEVVNQNNAAGHAAEQEHFSLSSSSATMLTKKDTLEQSGERAPEQRRTRLSPRCCKLRSQSGRGQGSAALSS